MEEVRLMDREQLVFVDESGSHIALTPLYGWAPKGQRAYGAAPRNRGHNTTILGALSWQGVQAAMLLEGAADGLAFEAFLEHCLVPTLVAGQIVVLDNLSIHKSVRVQAMIEKCGCQLLFLPPYSPDFSPIEQMWSKLKQYLRRCAARTKAALDAAIAQGLARINALEAQHWFQHCGYRLL